MLASFSALVFGVAATEKKTVFLKSKRRCGGPASNSSSFGSDQHCYDFRFLFGPDKIKTAFLVYALASFHLDCALVECLAYVINVFTTTLRQSYSEISIVYRLTAKAAIRDMMHCTWVRL